MPRKSKEDRNLRLETANEFIRIIASYGHKYFSRGGVISYFAFDSKNRIIFIDSYQGKRVWVSKGGKWRGFTNGGTMRNIIERLIEFINGKKYLPLRLLGLFPEWMCGGDPWAYGKDMQIVREKCAVLEGGVNDENAI